MTLDDIRARLPHCGFAIFAMDPAEDVVLEVYEPGDETFQWRGPTVQDVIDKAFPAPSGVSPGGGVLLHAPAQAPRGAAGDTPEGGVFD